MVHIVYIAAGGALGAVFRHLVGSLAVRLFGSGFPIGTLTVNIVGSFLMGILIEWLALKIQSPPSIGAQNLRLLLATGFLGGFTTFSAFSLETMLLWERGAVTLAAVYIAASVILSLAALAAGLALVRMI